MSKVNIEIDGLKIGLNISPEHVTDFIGALNAAFVESRKDARSMKASEARNEARDAFENMLSAACFQARRAS